MEFLIAENVNTYENEYRQTDQNNRVGAVDGIRAVKERWNVGIYLSGLRRP